MKWAKRPWLFKPERERYAAAPFAQHINGDYFRIFFTSRDTENRGHIQSVDAHIGHEIQCLHGTEKDVLHHGGVGAFDESGVTGSWITKYNGCNYLYYTGWTRGVTVPYYFYIGAAVENTLGFKRASVAPVIERSNDDPYLTASPCLMYDDGLWRMWYVSSVGREIVGDKCLPNYLIKASSSVHGGLWVRQGIVIDHKDPDEFGISRPCVIKEDGIYKMWYSYSTGKYRIGYAESTSPNSGWVRKDGEVGIDVSESGWDSDTIEYPFVFKHNGRTFMLYNGNNFGEDGFGYAVLEEK